MSKRWEICRRDGLISIVLFLVMLTCYAYIFPRWSDWNQNSRIDQVMAIVDKGKLYIDDYYQNTGDYAFYDGHYYSDKAPGTAFIGIPFYKAFNILFAPIAEKFSTLLENSLAFKETLFEGGTGILQEKVQFASALYFVTFFTISVPSAIMVVLLYHLLGKFTNLVRHRIAIVMAYGLATIAFPYSSLFMSHQLTAFLLLFAFFLLLTSQEENENSLQHFVVGLLLGFAIISEYPSVLIAGVFIIYASIKIHPKWRVIYILFGCFIPILVAMIYNYAIFSTPLPVAYTYSVLFQQHFTGGIMGMTFPKLEAIWGMTFSPYRGLFFLSPFLLLSFVGIVFWLKDGRYRAEAAIILGGSIAYLLVISSMALWSGGRSIGPRYLAILIPFLVLPLAFLFERFPTKHWLFILFFALVLISICMVWIETLSGQLFPGYFRNPFLEYSLPKFIEGDVARNWGTIIGLSGQLSLIPLILVVLIGVSVLWFITIDPQITENDSLVTSN